MAAAVVWAALAVVEPVSAVVPNALSAQYSGTLEMRYEQPAFEGNLASASYTYTLTWKEHASVPEGQGEASWTIDELKGSVKDVWTDGTGSSHHCSATLASNGSPGGQAFYPQGNKFAVIAAIPTLLTVTRPPSNDPNCSSTPTAVVTNFESSQTVLAAWAAVEKTTVTFPAKGSHVQPLNFSWHCPDAGCKGTESGTKWVGSADVEVKSSLAFAGPGFAIGSPQPSPGAPSKPPSAGTSIDPKILARADLRSAVRLAVAPCLGLTAVLGTQAAETAFTLAEPITAPLGLLGGQLIADIATDTLREPLLTICVDELRQIVVDYSVIKRDPPLPKPSSPLRLPSCTRWQGKLRAYCRNLEAEATKLVAAERAVLPPLKRLLSAGMALRNARAQHETNATASARARVNAAAGAVRAARAAAGAAGKNVADTIRAAGVQGKLTKKQADAATAAMLDQLAKQGVPTADLRKLAGSALTSASTDLLTALAA